jgi:hypothetical protein
MPLSLDISPSMLRDSLAYLFGLRMNSEIISYLIMQYPTYLKKYTNMKLLRQKCFLILETAYCCDTIEVLAAEDVFLFSCDFVCFLG